MSAPKILITVEQARNRMATIIVGDGELVVGPAGPEYGASNLIAGFKLALAVIRKAQHKKTYNFFPKDFYTGD